ncbi:hypothetical protein TNCV_5093771 [Trichonephila clavipes]|nr:hypothetical protein TNCV_5093771 [Trichonephila clavipes]
MLVLVHIDITPPHTPLPVFRRIGERTIPYSWRACKRLRHSCDGLRELHHLCDGLVAFAVDRWRREKCAVHITARVTNKGRRVRSGYLPFRMNASTLPLTPKRLSSCDVGTSSYRYHTATDSYSSWFPMV